MSQTETVETAEAVVVMYNGQGMALSVSIPSYMDAFQQEIERMEIDHNLPDNGVFKIRIDLIDDGPSDWPGARDCIPSVVEFHALSKEEWKAYRCGEVV